MPLPWEGRSLRFAKRSLESYCLKRSKIFKNRGGETRTAKPMAKMSKPGPKTGDRVLIDLSGQKHPADALTLRDSFENVFITGSTGSGKTSGSGYMLANALLDIRNARPEERAGMIIFLYKRTDKQDWLRWIFMNNREKDLIHLKATDNHVFNPLERYQTAEPMNAVNTLMNISQLALGGGNRKEGESFWEMEMQKRLDRLIRLNQLANLPLNILTLNQIHVSAPMTPEQLTDENFRKESFCWQLLAEAANIHGQDHPAFRMVEDYFVREMPWLADRTASSIRAMTSAILEPFVSSSLLRRFFCGESSLTLEDAFSGKIILLDIPVQTYEHAGRICQIMFKYVFQKAVEQRDLKQYPNPLIFWQDEAQVFLTPYDHSFMSTCRSSRAGSVILSQNISNFYAALGGGPQAEAQVNSLLALCNTKIFHANNDFVTNEWAAKTIGMGVRHLTSMSVGYQSETAGSSQHIHFLVEPREFSMLRNGGPENDWLVDSIIAGTGRIFSTGENYLPATFEQSIAP